MADSRVKAIQIIVEDIKKLVIPKPNFTAPKKMRRFTRISYSATLTGSENDLTVEFPSRTSLQNLASEDPEALQRLQLTKIEMASEG